MGQMGQPAAPGLWEYFVLFLWSGSTGPGKAVGPLYGCDGPESLLALARPVTGPPVPRAVPRLHFP